MQKKNGGLVYSTERGRMCPKCGQPESMCVCGMETTGHGSGNKVIKIRREKKGRAGKTVTAIYGVACSDLKPTAAAIKQQCGTGGSVKDGVIIIQGDHRLAVKSFLEKRGYTVKLAGG